MWMMESGLNGRGKTRRLSTRCDWTEPSGGACRVRGQAAARNRRSEVILFVAPAPSGMVTREGIDSVDRGRPARMRAGRPRSQQ